MVSLAVGTKKAAFSSDTTDFVRNNALWLSKFPSSKFIMNDTICMGGNPVFGYFPLEWTSFGGPGGIYLRHLTKVSICRGPYRPWILHRGISMKFHFGTRSIPAEHRTLNPGDRQDYEGFNIDGPNGEVINQVDIKALHHSISGTDREVLKSIRVSCCDIFRLACTTCGLHFNSILVISFFVAFYESREIALLVHG